MLILVALEVASVTLDIIFFISNLTGFVIGNTCSKSAISTVNCNPVVPMAGAYIFALVLLIRIALILSFISSVVVSVLDVLTIISWDALFIEAVSFDDF